jgi:group II intron reverse transcriptase/maturase
MQSLSTVSTKRARIAQLAREAPDLAFTSLNHYLDLDWLKEAFRLTRKDGASGVDGQSAQEYAAKLESNLQSLLDRAKSGSYFAPPVRRVHIPKGSGSETRPIGIPTLEDKVLQRAVVMLLESIYEQDFLDCSYGFRPGRSAHQALATIWDQTMAMKGGWVVELDIRKFFDTMSRSHLRTFLRQRVRDGVLLRLIGKWLNAGVMEAGALSYPEAGTPQGGVVSPLLANVYLHEVLDVWFEQDVKPRLRGRAFLVRYADDAVLGFEREDDARRVLEVLPKRFGRYGLTLHADKTRLVPFRPPRGPDDPGGPGSFDFLGFTHFWAKSRKGRQVVKRRTSSSRFTRALKRIAEYCRLSRHDALAEQHKALSQKLKGHYGYFGITGNSRCLGRFRWEVQRLWYKWLRRRGQRHPLTWERFNALLRAFPLPPPITVHSCLRRAAKA